MFILFCFSLIVFVVSFEYVIEVEVAVEQVDVALSVSEDVVVSVVDEVSLLVSKHDSDKS